MSSENNDIYNEDELISPDWMDKDFFEMVLRKSENDSLLQISDFKITPASKKGEHFASVIYRIIINYTSKTTSEKKISIILKTEPFVDGIKKDILGDKDVFNIEIKMYSETLPEIQKLLNSIGDDRQLTPKLLHHSLSPTKMIVFEDLSPEGYETVKDFGVGDELSKLAFYRLGQLHAASMVLHEKGGNVSSYKTSTYHMNFAGEGISFYLVFAQSMADEMKTWPGFESYVEMIEKNILVANEKAKEMFKANENSYNVLNHGDFHSKNMMFKNMNSKDAEIVMLDFQISFFGSPSLDLYQGLYLMTNSECQEDFIQYYYEVFSSTLEKLKYSGKIPTYLDLKNEIYKNRFYEIILASVAVPFATIDMATININDLFDKGKAAEVRKVLYGNPTTQEKFKRLLPDMLKRGVFD